MNSLPCPDPKEFREDQCGAFNGVPYEGNFYEWTPYVDDGEPCALTCKGRMLGAEENVVGDPVMVVARLAEKVQDGTRCRQGSLDMCIDGKCQMVGCDLRIGSNRQIDDCGACGGDGSCPRPLYHWTLTPVSLCSVTCGRGYRMARTVCQNRMTGDEVEEQLCNQNEKPDSTVMECNTHNCPPKWFSGEWSSCSSSCGGGTRLRPVHCVEEANNTKIRVSELKCLGKKPHQSEECNPLDCPKWHASAWSGCSMSCGEGVQIRQVDCRDEHGQPSLLCDPMEKPEPTRTCSTGIQCADSDEDLLPGLYHTQEVLQPAFSLPAHAEKLIGEQVVPSESTFIADEWGPCSATCGEGVRRRDVNCKIFLEFSRTIAKLPDEKCSGPKPPQTERCNLEPCSSAKVAVKDEPTKGSTTYSWTEKGYTHCSATCLGGVQELIVHCIRDDIQKIVAPFMCPKDQKPEILIRTCNDHPCPPRWNYSEFSPCSQTCGIGIQTRDVNCVHEVTQGSGNAVVVPNNMCPQPPPPDRQYCNVLDCPVKWKLSEWSKCTKTCGTGEKTRRVECIQVMAQNHTLSRPDALCPSPRPQEKKPCNTKPCVQDTDKPHIDVQSGAFIQHDARKKNVTVKVGGAATVFEGTTVKIKCPVKRFNRTRIQWLKDRHSLPKTKKYKKSKKGALRIHGVVYRDSGTYTCVAAKSSASLTLSVRPVPGQFVNSEEVQRQTFKNAARNGDFEIADVQAGHDDLNPIFNNDDQSHEQRQDLSRRKAKNPLFTPTLHSLRLEKTGEGGRGTNTPDPRQVNQGPGHQMVTIPEEFARIPEDLDEEQDQQIVVLGTGTRDNLKFEWTTGEWSQCTKSCGDNGIQERITHCMVRLHNTTEIVEENFCNDAKLEVPQTRRECTRKACPEWAVSDWTSCIKSKCFKFNTAMQTREVLCKIGNKTMEAKDCSQFEKPPRKQECPNPNCVGKWKVGPWSECSASCDGQGVKYRVLQCVWYGTRKPAGSACAVKPRPPLMKACKGPPCPKPDDGCADHSMFCQNVKNLRMCGIERYRQQCCHTCGEG